jgi:hypothetical protein
MCIEESRGILDRGRKSEGFKTSKVSKPMSYELFKEKTDFYGKQTPSKHSVHY